MSNRDTLRAATHSTEITRPLDFLPLVDFLFDLRLLAFPQQRAISRRRSEESGKGQRAEHAHVADDDEDDNFGNSDANNVRRQLGVFAVGVEEAVSCGGARDG